MMKPAAAQCSPVLVHRVEDWSRPIVGQREHTTSSNRSSSQYSEVDTPPSIAYAIFPSSGNHRRPPMPSIDPERLSILSRGAEMTLSKSYESELSLDCGHFPLPPTRPSAFRGDGAEHVSASLGLIPSSSFAARPTISSEPTEDHVASLSRAGSRPTLGSLAEDHEETSQWLAYMTGETASPSSSTASPSKKERDSPIRTTPRRRPHTSDAMQRLASAEQGLLLSHHRLFSLGNSVDGQSRPGQSSSGSPTRRAPSPPRLASSFGLDALPSRPQLVSVNSNASSLTDEGCATARRIQETQARRMSTRPGVNPPPRLPLPDPYATKDTVFDATPTRPVVRPRTASLSSRSSRTFPDGVPLSNRSSRDHAALPSPATPVTPLPKTPGSATPLGRIPFPSAVTHDAGRQTSTLQQSPPRTRSKSAFARPKTAPGLSPPPRLQPMASTSNLTVESATPRQPEVRRVRSSTFRTVSQSVGGKLKSLAKTIVRGSAADDEDDDTSSVWGSKHQDDTLDLEEWWMDTLVKHHPSKSSSIGSVDGRPALTEHSLDEAMRGLSLWSEREVQASLSMPRMAHHPYQFRENDDDSRRGARSPLPAQQSTAPRKVEPCWSAEEVLEHGQGDVSLDYSSIALGITETEYVEEMQRPTPSYAHTQGRLPALYSQPGGPLASRVATDSDRSTIYHRHVSQHPFACH